MGRAELLIQAEGGLLLHGIEAERLASHYSFYAAFHSAREYRVMAGRQTLGAMPVQRAVGPGALIIFAGRRWQVTSIEPEARVIHVTASRGGAAPEFNGEGMRVADEVRRRMRALYRGQSVPPHLDPTAGHQLDHARRAYRRWDLDTDPLLQDGADTTMFVWRGDTVLNTLSLLLRSAGPRWASAA